MKDDGNGDQGYKSKDGKTWLKVKTVFTTELDMMIGAKWHQT